MWHSWCFRNNSNPSKLPNRNSQLLLLELTCSVIWLYYFTSLNSSRRSSIISAIGNTNYVLNRGLCNSFATCLSSTVQTARVWAVAVSSQSNMTDKLQDLNGHKCGRLRVWGRHFSEIVRNKFTFRNSLDCVLFVFFFSLFYSSTSTYVQPLTEMSTRNIFWMLQKSGAEGWQPYHHPVPLSWNLGTLTSWNPLGHSRPVTGLLYLYLYFNLRNLSFSSAKLCAERNENI